MHTAFNPMGVTDMAKDYIIDYGNNENGYYRKWKSGFIEQWGNYQSISSESSIIYNFPISFNNIPIQLYTQCKRYFDNDTLIVFNYDNITNSTFSGVTNFSRGGLSNELSVPFYWYACGY